MVILESGISATSISWTLVQRAVQKFARVIAYDRAGLGWSEPSASPRTPANLVAELRAGLAELHVAPPYILVGHSFGGLIVEQFAIDHPHEVAGIVLVDPMSPAEYCPLSEYNRQRLSRGAMLSRRGALLARIGVVRACLSLVLGGNATIPKLAARVSSGQGGSGLTSRIAGEVQKLPRETWPAIAFHWSLPKSFETMARYLDIVPQAAAELAGRRLPDIPVTYIPAAHNQHGPGVLLPEGARTMVAEKSGHWVQLDEPELVVEAIRAMLDYSRLTCPAPKDVNF